MCLYTFSVGTLTILCRHVRLAATGIDTLAPPALGQGGEMKAILHEKAGDSHLRSTAGTSDFPAPGAN